MWWAELRSLGTWRVSKEVIGHFVDTWESLSHARGCEVFVTASSPSLRPLCSGALAVLGHLSPSATSEDLIKV